MCPRLKQYVSSDALRPRRAYAAMMALASTASNAPPILTLGKATGQKIADLVRLDRIAAQNQEAAGQESLVAQLLQLWQGIPAALNLVHLSVAEALKQADPAIIVEELAAMSTMFGPAYLLDWVNKSHRKSMRINQSEAKEQVAQGPANGASAAAAASTEEPSSSGSSHLTSPPAASASAPARASRVNQQVVIEEEQPDSPPSTSAAAGSTEADPEASMHTPDQPLHQAEEEVLRAKVATSPPADVDEKVIRHMAMHLRRCRRLQNAIRMNRHLKRLAKEGEGS